ncbi:uncharacterized protein BX664DRAFT_389635 [Halteromyces radiatus]|uniref:uncharacterized protein n=1 Tax=Halteromyces radiatus TaxID=101107 RepID=UPI00221FC41C|nr:uncharacterized protein BX664DRAFT_389635 [Halteromyces radiatus]KAI8076300.1 hypothetical protein BX664DRAFT_389635 [Halteromyces radiatus]
MLLIFIDNDVSSSTLSAVIFKIRCFSFFQTLRVLREFQLDGGANVKRRQRKFTFYVVQILFGSTQIGRKNPVNVIVARIFWIASYLILKKEKKKELRLSLCGSVTILSVFKDGFQADVNSLGHAQKIMEEIKNYPAERIYNVDESGLFHCNKAEIVSLQLVDNGLYITTPLSRLSMPKSPLEFVDGSMEWFEYQRCNGKYFIVVDLHQSQYDWGNRMFYFTDSYLGRKRTILSLDTMIASAGTMDCGQTNHHYVFRKSMVLGQDTNSGITSCIPYVNSNDAFCIYQIYPGSCNYRIIFSKVDGVAILGCFLVYYILFIGNLIPNNEHLLLIHAPISQIQLADLYR